MANTKFCTECGQRLEEGVKFCPNCGNAVSVESAGKSSQNNTYTSNVTQNSTPYYTPGFSDRINDPEIKNALRKTHNISRIFLFIFLPIPIIVACIIALSSDKVDLGEAFIVGVVISGITLLCSIFSRMSRSSKNFYEAVVLDKKREYKRDINDNERSYYNTIVKTTSGEKKIIEESNNTDKSAYEYLRVGDRFRYHPQLAYPYEKFDKSKDGFVYCACCTKKNDLSNDRCVKCGVPLLK